MSVNLSFEDLLEIPVPAILYFSRGHFVILEKITKKNTETYFHIIDPNIGRVKYTKQVLLEKWSNSHSGIATIVHPNQDFFKKNFINKKSEKSGLIPNMVWNILSRRKNRLILIFVFTLIALATNWGMPLLLKENIDKGIMSKNLNLVWYILASQFIFIISNIIANGINEILSTKISININIDLKNSYFNKILNLPISYFESKFKSDLIEGLNDLNRINNFISRNIIELIISLLNLIVFSVILISYNFQIFSLFVGFSLISIIITFFFLKKKKVIDYAMFNSESENRNRVYELILGITEIKVNSGELRKISKWKQSEEKLNKIKIKDSYINFFMFNSSNFISKFRDIFLIGVCSFLIIENRMTMGTMLMISYVLGQLSAPIGDIIDFSDTFQRLKIAFERLADVYNKNEEVLPDKSYQSEFALEDDITCRNLSFKYNSNDTNFVLQNINLTIKRNTITAIVGASGSGKTSLLKLLLGFYFPLSGEINIGNNDIKDVNLKDWRKKCGVIMQDGYIFSGTIAENISLSDVNCDLEKVKYSAKIAEIDDVINRFPLKYDTLIGESGISLSGGEKQRLYIARAIYKNPDFIFFDEATSNLDTINESKIMQNLTLFLKNKTAIVIAHRLSTIKKSDNIVVIDNGFIVEQGTHSQLYKNKSVYYELVKSQLDMNF